MASYSLVLRPLNDREISRVCTLLTRVSPLLTKASTLRFRDGVSKMLRHDEHRFKGSLPSLGSLQDLRLARERWMRIVTKAKFGAELAKAWSVLSLNVIAEISEFSKESRVDLNFEIPGQYFDWLLIRAIANGQVRRFIQCEFCVDVKCVEISRDDIKFCREDHRVKYHYFNSRRGAKDVVRHRQELHAKGIPTSPIEFAVLRDSHAARGTKLAKRLLASLPVSIADLYKSEIPKNALHANVVLL
jgi:hypothetical protein